MVKAFTPVVKAFTPVVKAFTTGGKFTPGGTCGGVKAFPPAVKGVNAQSLPVVKGVKAFTPRWPESD